MQVFKCVRCSGMFSTDHGNKWGETAESDGYGPHARCTELVPNKNAPMAIDAQRVAHTPLQVCGGQLYVETIDERDVEVDELDNAAIAVRARGQSVRQVTPIIPNRWR